MRYEIRLCDICSSVISIYTKFGTKMSPDAHRNKQTCGNSDCLTELQSRNSQKHSKVFKIKKCKRCPEDISTNWPGGARKNKPDYDEQMFCSNKCRADWKNDNFWFPTAPITKSSILCQALRASREYPTNSIDHFIY